MPRPMSTLTGVGDTPWAIDPAHGYVFASIPRIMWWSAVTLTTVGYGDMSPTTPVSRFLGGTSMIAGILLIALPVAVIGANFHRVFKREQQLAQPGRAVPEPASPLGGALTAQRVRGKLDA